MKNIYLKAALVADSLSLGSHWIYNQSKLQRLYPNGISDFSAPASTYHPTKAAGDFTHYGDQTLLLKNSFSKLKSFSLEFWRTTWLEGIGSYDGYIDGATKQTYESLGKTPSDSNDLAGASRLAPILDLDIDLPSSILAAREQTSLTHGDPGLPDAAEFFVHAAFALQKGLKIQEAFEEAAAQGNYTSLPVQKHLQLAQSLLSKDVLKSAAEIGLTCHLPEAFPLTLFIALQPNDSFLDIISMNGLAGGDTSARAMLLAVLFASSNQNTVESLHSKLNYQRSHQPHLNLTPGSNKVSISTPHGLLAGILEFPESKTKAYAIFAHCFTCGKDFLPEKKITQRLAHQGIATLRLDFRGIGSSKGDFSRSSFKTNIEDLILASTWLEENYGAPQLLIGHSLGGAAVLAAAPLIPSTKAIATIGAPAEAAHVTQLFAKHIPEITEKGKADIQLAGRTFTIGKAFLDDLEGEEQLDKLKNIDKLILHSPEDTTVALKNAGEIYTALSHPKSFISLAGTDHLLIKKGKAEYVADLIAIWSSSALDPS